MIKYIIFEQTPYEIQLRSSGGQKAIFHYREGGDPIDTFFPKALKSYFVSKGYIELS